jgi:hypothetical protein
LRIYHLIGNWFLLMGKLGNVGYVGNY